MRIYSSRDLLIAGLLALGQPGRAADIMLATSRKLWRRRMRARLMQLKYGAELRGLRHFGLFIGYPRSGHTLVAALLDAHPRMVFANGLDAAQYLARDFSVPQVAALSIWNSLRFTRHGRRSNGYNYTVPDGWHGRWDELRVVGDKSGDLFSDHLRHSPWMLAPILDALAAKGRFVHVIRNPYDCISSLSLRGGKDLRAASRDFFGLCEVNARARQSIGAQAWTDVFLEELIQRPRRSMRALCNFFGEDADSTYLAGCADLVFQVPQRSTRPSSWDAALIREVDERLKPYPWFDGYNIENAARHRDDSAVEECQRSPRKVA